MKKLLVLVLFVVAVVYGWKHYGELLTHRVTHEAVIVNHAGRAMARVRLTVDGKTLVRDAIADDEKAVIPFRVEQASTLDLVWEWADADGSHRWTGGMVTNGPIGQRHVITIDNDGEVVYQPGTK